MSYGRADPLKVIKADLGRIREILEQGWHILGWKNQDSGGGYAVGGAGDLPSDRGNEIQTTLHNFAVKYKSKE